MSTAIEPEHRHQVRHRRRRGHHRRLPLSAPAAFYGAAALGVLSLPAASVGGRPALLLSGLAAGLILYLILMNKKRGFRRPQRMFRSTKRTSFSNGEVIILLGLLMLNFLAGVMVWMAG